MLFINNIYPIGIGGTSDPACTGAHTVPQMTRHLINICQYRITKDRLPLRCYISRTRFSWMRWILPYIVEYRIFGVIYKYIGLRKRLGGFIVCLVNKKYDFGTPLITKKICILKPKETQEDQKTASSDKAPTAVLLQLRSISINQCVSLI